MSRDSIPFTESKRPQAPAAGGGPVWPSRLPGSWELSSPRRPHGGRRPEEKALVSRKEGVGPGRLWVAPWQAAQVPPSPPGPSSWPGTRGHRAGWAPLQKPAGSRPGGGESFPPGPWQLGSPGPPFSPPRPVSRKPAAPTVPTKCSVSWDPN